MHNGESVGADSIENTNEAGYLENVKFISGQCGQCTLFTCVV